VQGFDVATTLDFAEYYAKRIEPGCVPYIQTLTLEEINLDEGMGQGGKAPIGFTYKCLGAAFWALREWNLRETERHGDLYPDRFLDILRTVIRAGGDTDTNGAVAGALLGAITGSSHMPVDLIEALVPKSALDQRVQRLIDIMDL
jgi:hypothetical protein